MLRMILMAALAMASLVACGGKDKGGETMSSGGGSADTSPKLYDRLGKKDAIAGVVKDFVEERVAKDPRIKDRFLNSNVPELEAKLTDQICEATGGPCKYTGKDMVTAHQGMNIKEAEFTALVEDLKASLDKFKVPDREQKELLGALAKMHDAIVTAK